jgi:hypothetical protein
MPAENPSEKSSMALPGYTAKDALARWFLDLRHQVLDVAAGLDRIHRAEGGESLSGDPRMKQLDEALEVLRRPDDNRAERVQMIFSLPSDPDWRAGPK